MISEALKINGLTVYYRVGGDPQKPTLLWLDGLSISKDLNGRLAKTERFLKNFFDDFHIISFEYPSFMRSDIPETEWNINNYVELIHEFIIEAKLSTPLLIMGHSFGAMLAYAYTAKYPGDIKLLVISAPPITYKYSKFYYKIFNLLEKLEDIVFDSNIIPVNIKKMVPKYFMSSSSENLKRYNVSELKLAVKTFTHMARFDYSTMTKDISVKTIFITGDKDYLVPVKNSLEVIKSIKNCTHYNFNEGHTTLPWQIAKLKPKIINEIISI